MWTITNVTKAQLGSYWPILSLVGKFCGVVVLFSGSEQFFKGESIHKSVLFITASLVTASILFLYYLCRLSIVVNSSRFPEIFKVRAPRGSAQEEWLSGAMGTVRDVKHVILALAIRLFLAPRGSVQQGWLSGAMGRRDVKACQFSISNQALLSREQKQNGKKIFILERNDSACQFRHACTDHSFKPIWRSLRFVPVDLLWQDGHSMQKNDERF